MTRARRLAAWVAILACITWVGLRYVLPEVVAARIRRELASRGFPDARLFVDHLGLHRMRLSGVTLGVGLVLGTVEIDTGLSYLWRDPEEITVRGAEVTWAALAPRATGAGPPAADRWSISRLSIEDSVLAIGDSRVAISGHVARRSGALAVDLVARTEAVRLGGITLADVNVRARDANGAIRACATARVERATGEACSTLPSSIAGLAELRVADLDWRARDDAWTASGDARLARADGRITVERGRVNLEGALSIGVVDLEAAAIEADVAGDLSDLSLRGDLHAKRVGIASGAVRLRDVELPFALRAALLGDVPRLSATRSLTARARAADVKLAGSTVEVRRPTITMQASPRRPLAIDPSKTTWSRTVSWRAREARWRSARFEKPSGRMVLDGDRTRQTTSWTSVRGWEPLQLGAGQLRFRTQPGRARIESGTVRSTGGQILVEPFVARANQACDVVLQLRGLGLDRVLAELGRGRVAGTGRLDGEVVLRVGETSTSIVRGTVHARGRGLLRVRDASLSRRALQGAVRVDVHNRVVAALADFDYSQLRAVLGPTGTDPELRVSLAGRGRRLAQELDIQLNLRGVRDASRVLGSRAGR